MIVTEHRAAQVTDNDKPGADYSNEVIGQLADLNLPAPVRIGAIRAAEIEGLAIELDVSLTDPIVNPEFGRA